MTWRHSQSANNFNTLWSDQAAIQSNYQLNHDRIWIYFANLYKKKGSLVWNPIPLSKVIPVVTSFQNLETGWLTTIPLPSEICSQFNTCTLRCTQIHGAGMPCAETPYLSCRLALVHQRPFPQMISPDALQPSFSPFLSVVWGSEDERWLLWLVKLTVSAVVAKSK